MELILPYQVLDFSLLWVGFEIRPLTLYILINRTTPRS